MRSTCPLDFPALLPSGYFWRILPYLVLWCVSSSSGGGGALPQPLVQCTPEGREGTESVDTEGMSKTP